MSDGRIDPRITHTRTVVRAAALAELAEVGYGEFTIEGVAERASVAKSTIYRHWDGRASLVADALVHRNVQPEPQPGSESPRDRIRILLTHLCEAMVDPTLSATAAALVDASERDDEVARLHHESNDRRRAALTDAIEEAIADGQVDATVDAQTAALALAGAIIYRRLLTATPFDVAAVDTLVTTVLGSPR